MTNNLSVAICNKNSINHLKQSIPALLNANLKDLFVIDSFSTDQSIEYLKANGVKIYNDGGKGLSFARGLAVKKSKKKYIFLLGPDDVITKYKIQLTLKKFIKSKYSAATVLIKIKKTITVWDNFLNSWFKYIRPIGDSKTIGTPTLFDKKVFKNVKYSKKNISCDDTDISAQLIKNKYKIGTLNITFNQSNNNTYRDVFRKFYDFGKSDCHFYLHLGVKKRNLDNKVNAFFHPAKHFFKCSFFFYKNNKLNMIFFLLLFTFIRYHGFFLTLLFYKTKNS